MSDDTMPVPAVTRAGLRWAFNFHTWRPTQAEWMLAAQCVQSEEKERIAKFVFRVDAKAAVCGRLLLRKAISESLHVPWREINLGRTEKGKPYLVNPADTSLSFNVSHQGQYAILAAQTDGEVGVDVMETRHPRGSKSVEDFFTTMKRQFTMYEWMKIREPITDIDKLARFYRFWCLKESYVKAVGVGIGFSLQRLSFKIGTPNLESGTLATDTRLYVDGQEATEWEFQETMIDRHHCAAVAVRQKEQSPNTGSSSTTSEIPRTSGLFTTLSFNELVNGAQPLAPRTSGLFTTLSFNELVNGAQPLAPRTSGLFTTLSFNELVNGAQPLAPRTSGLFTTLSFNELVNGAQPLSEPDLNYWKSFSAKEESPGS